MSSRAVFGRVPLLTVAVCGFGSIGQRHAANIVALGARTIVVTRDPKRAARAARKLNARITADLDGALDTADAVIVATPTDEHIGFAMKAVRAGKALFLEKPVSSSRAGVGALERLATRLVVEVGCQLRAHPALRILKKRLASGADGKLLTFRGVVGQRLDTWRPGADYRRSYSADAARGGGALFDLVHEVDLARWLCGPIAGLSARLSKVSTLQMKAEDLANLLIECEGGACGSLQLDMLSPVYRRSFEVICEQAIYSFGYADGALVRSTARGSRTLYSQPPGFQRNDLFMTHMSHFLKRVRKPEIAPLCSLADGIACLDALLAARKSSRTGRWLVMGEGGRA